MAKLKLKVGAEAAKVAAVEGFKPYDGPTPPKGVYPAVVRVIDVQESKKTKKDMLRVIVDIAAPKSDKRSKFNGYSMFDYLVIPDDSEEEHYGLLVGKVNALLDAMSNGKQSVRDALWGGEAVISDDKTPRVERIGPLNIKGSKNGVPVIVTTKDEMRTFMEEDEDGELVEKTQRQLRINSYHPAEDAKSDEPEEPEVEEIEEEEEPEEAPKPRRRRKPAPKPEPEPEPEDDEDDEDEEEPEAEDPEESFAEEHLAATELPDDEDDEDEPEEEEEPEEKPARRRRRAAF